MKLILRITALAVLVISGAAASAQYVKGNEAVSVTGSSKRIETAPFPATGSARNSKPCAANAGCYPGPWIMVETDTGLMECTEVFARPGTCRPSTYGTKKIARLWLVKSKGKWLQCQYPDLGSKCVEVFARPPANLPYDAVQ